MAGALGRSGETRSRPQPSPGSVQRGVEKGPGGGRIRRGPPGSRHSWVLPERGRNCSSLIFPRAPREGAWLLPRSFPGPSASYWPPGSLALPRTPLLLPHPAVRRVLFRK